MTRGHKDGPVSLEDTLPAIRIDSGEEATDTIDEALVTSAPASTIATTDHTSGAVTMSGERILEEVARELIRRRFGQAGIHPIADYRLHEDDLLVCLDGFDPEARVGFQFVSHADADVVTDFDREAEVALARMATETGTHVLVIHDHEAPTGEVILERVEAFLRHIGR